MIPSKEGVSMGSLEVVLDFVPALELRVVSTCAAKLSLSSIDAVVMFKKFPHCVNGCLAPTLMTSARS